MLTNARRMRCPLCGGRLSSIGTVVSREADGLERVEALCESRRHWVRLTVKAEPVAAVKIKARVKG